MVVVKSLTECLMNITKLKRHLKKREKLTEEKLIRIKKLQLMTVQRIHQQLRVERAIPLQKDQARQDPYKFTDFVNCNFSGLFRFRSPEDLQRLYLVNCNFSGLFRFRSPEDLQRLYEGLQLPGPTRVKTYKTTGQEILMVSLVRLLYPHRWEDVERIFVGIQRWKLQRMFYWFLDFMIENWSYLILNNRDFWTPLMPTMARAIEVKLASLPNPDYRLFFPEEVPFTIFGFIDNTMHAMCRPGGGPITGGVQAERVPKLVQQAWWTGWKKLHGLKMQTVFLPNGMDFEIWGPVSCRHNDNYTLAMSNILEKLADCQEGNALKYAMFGDSAYMDNDYLLTGGGRGMSSVREPIEWDYKDVKSQCTQNQESTACQDSHCMSSTSQCHEHNVWQSDIAVF
jgi:hypothetical protein